MQQPPTDEPLSPPVAGAGGDDDGSHAIPSGSPYVFSPDAHAHLTPYLAALHGSCITHDRMTGSFLPPLNHEKLLGWWKVKMAEVASERRVIIILLDESEPGARAKGPELVGAVMLGTPPTETSPHCGLVESLLVSPRHRSRGGARMLLAALEVEAARRGRYLLVRPFDHHKWRACFVSWLTRRCREPRRRAGAPRKRSSRRHRTN